MANITLTTLNKIKQNREKFATLTAYDATFAQVVSTAGVEVILVGDSLGMVLQGNDSTLPATIEDMCYHTTCVAKGNQGSLIIADLPFMTFDTPANALENAAKLMRAGAQVVKFEGGKWLCETVQQLTRNGIPSCLHLGLTPQSVNVFGGYKVQGREEQAAKAMLEDVKALEQAGASLFVLECVPSPLAQAITESVSVPVIGIGAGAATDSQVLVLHDMLGISPGKSPRFVKNFMAGADSIQAAIENYVTAVKSRTFPAAEHEFKA
ncbi:3-methyl-2-oxobutanoate hydroxymethyltransferase [Spartinivicinus poritis]|uniref:3-methyl-2-oxobutanoate hydroxymethyltransferase n=1 Tax=Spartinivicinus poritis TaxID=2994640 RepID=A0ABT5U9V5_9GAMM|nr:3-methyl-2-oxobutanoate hydroxymethyltransferase [Spartinivicinus sp. A2-2]MDE1463150.1 3-methyl-2-oxobutanoate hydroxymethyltransferase [Spartinivicinus sp. A2-2]